jgi:rhodanese-related sulfurtransferase
MPRSVQELLAEAHAAVPRVDAREAERLAAEEDALLLDVREPAELAQTGKVRGAVNVPRGLLEFKAEPTMPSHDPAFRKDRPVVIYCAAGARAALAGKALKDLGFERVYNLGGFKDIVEAGMPTETC